MARAFLGPRRHWQVAGTVLMLLLLHSTALSLSWTPWATDTASSRTAPEGGPTPSSAGRVYDYNGFHAAVARHGSVDVEALWTEMQARARLSACWKQMLASLHATCRTVRGHNDLRSRLALGMATCDAEADGRMDAVFHCPPSHKVQRCVQSLSEAAYGQFVQYRLHADSLCAYLEAEIYHERTDVVMAALRSESAAAVQALEGLQTASEHVRAQLSAAAVQQEQQRLAALAVQAQLLAMEEGQAAALSTLRASADALEHSSAQTEASLAALREGMAQAARGAAHAMEMLAVQSRTHFEALEGHTTGLLRALTRLEHVQRAVAEQLFSAHDGIRGAFGLLLVLVLTSFSRTAAARWPAVMLVAASVVLPALMGWGARLRLLPRTAPVAVSGLGLLAALSLIAVVYLHATAAAAQQRDDLREAIERGVEQTVQRVAQLLPLAAHTPVQPPLCPADTQRVSRAVPLPLPLSWAAPRASAEPLAAAVPLTWSESLACSRARIDTEADVEVDTPLVKSGATPSAFSLGVSSADTSCTELDESTVTVAATPHDDEDDEMVRVLPETVVAALGGRKRGRPRTATPSTPSTPRTPVATPCKKARRGTPATRCASKKKK